MPRLSLRPLLCLLPLVSIAGVEEEVPGLRRIVATDGDFTAVVEDRRVRAVGFDEIEDLAGSIGIDRDDIRAVRYHGTLHVAEGGEHVFRVEVDDAARILIDGVQVLPRWATRDGGPEWEESVHLEAGPHDFQIDYRNDGGGGEVAIEWEGPGLKRGPLDDHVTTASWGGMSVVDREAFADDGERVRGLRARFYADTACDELAAERLVGDIDVAGGLPFADGRSEEFAVEWTGVLRIDRAGEYRFRCEHDDGAQLRIAGRDVFGEWHPEGGGHGRSEGRIELAEGLHPFHLRYNQGRGDAELALTWRGPGVDEGPIPAERLRTSPWPEMRHRAPMLVFLFVGHSNLDGRAGGPAGEVHPRAWIWDDDRWRRPDDGDNGPVRPFLATVAERYPDHRVGAVRIAKSGSSVDRDWREGKRNFAEAVAAAEEVGRHGHLVGIVSFLGWCDGGERDRAIAEGFAEDFPRFVADLRAAIGDEDLAWIASKAEWGRSAMKSEESEARWRMVYDSFAEFPDRIADLVTVESEGIDLRDNHHFSTRGYEQWAERLDAVLEETGIVDRAIADLPPLPELPAESKSETPAGACTVVAELVRASRTRTPDELGTYEHCLVVHEYRVRKVVDGAYEGERLLAIDWAVRDREPQPAASYREGSVRRLRCEPWRAHRKLHSLPLDDDIVDVVTPHFLVEAADEP